MKNSAFRRHAFSVGAICALLAGCSESQPPVGPSTALSMTAGRTAYSVLYSFKGQGAGGDGAFPDASLVDVKGAFYGTTDKGGIYCTHHRGGCGTVFSVTPSGAEKVLHSFGDSDDGAYPLAGLIDVDGTLYGTTSSGGVDDKGIVFSITRSGTETVLHSFTGAPKDGSYPDAGLLNVGGKLYGTTSAGGASGGSGTVFSITTSGTESVLYSFKGASSEDGADPVGALVDLNGKLYGTTVNGGAVCNTDGGCGTVFSITPSGTETVLHAFKGGQNDGAYPYVGLVNVAGLLYGTTINGGENCGVVSSGYGCGIVFSIAPSGKEKALYDFTGISGALPSAVLANVNGQLYGTTVNGGNGFDCSPAGCGTVFSMTPSGTEKVLHNFEGGSSDGALPYAGLINVKGKLYGTTENGGVNGVGTVFSLSS